MTFRIYTRRKEGTSAVVLCLCFCVLLVHVQADRDHIDQHWPKCLTNKPNAIQRRDRELTLEVSSRITHQLATHIFRILLEEEFGYARVKIIYYDEYNVENITERLNCYEGPLDNIKTIEPVTTINLEVPIPPDYIISSMEKGCFEELGVISPPGHFGLFIPSVLVQDIKQYDNSWKSDSFDIHWTKFKEPEFAETFDLATETKLMKIINSNTGNIGSKKYFCNDTPCKDGWYIPDRCKGKLCAVVLAPDFNNSNILIDHIDQMEVFVKVVWVGPNLETVSKKLTDNLQHKHKTFMIFSWTPSNTILNPTDFVVVSMGSCEVGKNGTTTGIGCFYGLRRSVKFATEKVRTDSKETYDLLKSMTFMDGENDFASLMNIYKNKAAIGKSIPEIACDWIQTQNTSWTMWDTSSQRKKKKLFIGGIFPITGSTYTGRGIVRGAIMAKNAINKNNTILSDYDLNVLVADGQCRADKVMRAFIDYLTPHVHSSLVGVLGPACSDTVEPLAGLSKYYKTITISYSAEGAVFSDRDKYPYFLRTIGENTHYKYVYLELLNKLKWKRVAALTEDGQKYTEYISHMQNMLEANHITFISNAKFPRVRERDPMTKYLEDLKQKQARIIIADVFDEIARNVMCEAHRLKMTAKQGYVWFLPTWLNTTWYDTNYFNQHLNESVNCTTANMIEAINGYFTITHAFYNDDEALMQENITVKQWKQNYTNLDKERNETSNYAGYAYDAVWTFALAVDKLIKEDPDAMYSLHSVNVTNKLTEIIKTSDFNGVSGRINFRGGTTRFSVINVMQWHDNHSKIIGKFYPNISDHDAEIIGGRLDLNESAIVWLSGGRPDDGTLPADECALNALAKFLSVKCDMAIIILNLFIIVLLLATLGTVILIIKRRYDKKVMNTEQYMKSLGLEHLLATSDYTGLDKWEIARENVVLNRKLGEGAFGTVYGGEAKLPDTGWTPVAVKTLKIGSTPDEKLDFLSEAEVMKRFDHKNIVKLLGVCTKIEPVYTIMEFMLYGDLKTYLLARRHLVNGPNVDESEEVSSKKLTQMAIDVARGLSYLAELKYVHRDVASRNCLLNGQRVVKLGDFGMTRPTCDNDYYKFNRKGMLPVRWMAPESLALGVFTPSSDVWSFGVLLYEIITFGSFPFQGLSNFQVLEYVKAGNTITIPQGVKPATEFLLKTCWSSDPKLRPTASELVEYLANNSRIISPCLDLPLSSVQMEDTGQLEMQLPDQFRKCSSSLSFKNLPLANGISPMSVHSPTRRQQSIPCDSGVSIPLENCCPKEPLLPPRSDSISGCSKYVTLQHSDSGCEQEQDNYFPNSIINGHAVSKV